MMVNLTLCTNQCYMRLSSIFSKESAILTSLVHLDINKCTPDDLSKKLFNVGMLAITYDNFQSPRLLPKKILKGPLELNAENLGAQHMK